MLNFTKYFLIIFLNSGLHSFSNDYSFFKEPELQSVYRRYDQKSHHYTEVPENLCELYEFHRTNILDDYKGYYANKEHNDQIISDFCYMGLLLFADNSHEKGDKEVLSILQYADNPSKPNKYFRITQHRYFKIVRHPSSGHSGAEIYILHAHNMRNPRVAKIFKCQSPKDLRLGFLELSNSLVALSLNPDPSNIKMARILSAGYSFFPGSKNPYIFCMVLEMASGTSIKELLHNKFIDNPNMFDEVLTDSAQYLAYFHVNSSRVFINTKIDAEVKKAEIKDREEFCFRRVRLLLQDFEFSPRGEFFINFKDALKNIEGIFGQGIQTPIKDVQPQPESSSRPNGEESQDRRQTSRPSGPFILANGFSSLERDSDETPQDSSSTFPSSLLEPRKDECIPGRVINQRLNEELISLRQYLIHILRKSESWYIPEEDRVITHGDMHTGNLCHNEYEDSPLLRLTMIDFSSIKRTYGAIGDFAQDVGKFLGSIWKEVALGSAQKYGDKDSMEALYSTLYKWQEVFLSAYIGAYTHSASALIKRESHEPFTIMATFRERVYFFKLCLYTQFFDDTRIGGEAKELLNAKELLFYFFLRESGLLGSCKPELTRKDRGPLDYILIGFILDMMGD